MNEHIDMKISGSSSMPGGEYRRVSISGAGKVQGSLKCEELHCSGAAKVLWAAGAPASTRAVTPVGLAPPSMQVTGIAAASFRLAAVTRILPSACWLALTCRSGTAWSSWFSRVVSA